MCIHRLKGHSYPWEQGPASQWSMGSSSKTKEVVPMSTLPKPMPFPIKWLRKIPFPIILWFFSKYFFFFFFFKHWGLSRTPGFDSLLNCKLSYLALGNTGILNLSLYPDFNFLCRFSCLHYQIPFLWLHFPFSWHHESDQNVTSSCLWLSRVRPFYKGIPLNASNSTSNVYKNVSSV